MIIRITLHVAIAGTKTDIQTDVQVPYTIESWQALPEEMRRGFENRQVWKIIGEYVSKRIEYHEHDEKMVSGGTERREVRSDADHIQRPDGTGSL